MNRAMTPGQIARWMAERGHRFEVQGEQLHVIPEPNSDIVARLRKVKAELFAFVTEHGGFWPPIASTHRYVVWSGARDRAASVCLSCGCPPVFHGLDALRDPLVLEDPNDAPLIEAVAIVAGAAAERSTEDAR